ncbi:Helicase, C-terminal [Dillenia turbinata]|uniref:Helicase, C-terminal n=1 Tax=Dillenia turbinata TaxID=194707 RepID=A0AAN8UN18_9MAGN
MKYDQRLIAAAKLVITQDAGAGDAPPPSCAELGITATLKPHQVEGISWLIRRYLLGVNVLLVVLCPLSVIDGWVSEITNYAPKLSVLRYVGEKEYRRSQRRTIHEHVKAQSSLSEGFFLPFDVLLTTYDIALIDQDFLSQVPWQYSIIDEAQRLKNPSSVLYNVLRERYVMPRRLLMTGTPIQNNLTELWALMHFCLPLVFGTLEEFLSTFKDAGDPLSGHNARYAKEQFKVLKYVLRAFMLRRTKSKLIESGMLVLPPLTEITVMAPMVTLQKKVYMSILRKELPKLLAVSSGVSSHQSLQNILRKACSHPYLFPGIEPEPYTEGEHLVQASGKLIVLDQLLQKLHSSGHRVLLFSQMTHTLDILQDFMELRKYSYERLDGSIRAEERFAAIKSFSKQLVQDEMNGQVGQHSAFVFMISTRAGGVGLNLVAADTVIFYEQDWNPQVDKQALQRAHRIGQMNPVLSINLVTQRLVEEIIMRRAERKLLLSCNVIGEDNMSRDGKVMPGVNTGDIRSVIFGLHMFDPAEVSDEKSGETNMLELSAMTDKIIEMRQEQKANKNDRKFEIYPEDLQSGFQLPSERDAASTIPDPGLDEASYLSWVKKFKELSHSSDNSGIELDNRKSLLNEKHRRLEAVKKKAEEKKLARWEALGYQSMSVKDPIFPEDGDVMSDSGSVQYVYGDCTNPSAVCASEATIIFSCVDDSGKWGHGGMFDALSRLSASIPDVYQRASEFKDLHLGDLHLIKIKEDYDCNVLQWVGLAVVQSYNPRRKVPRSDISIPDLECCLAKAAFSAAQNSASIHMPRIGYQDGSNRSEWYCVERLLRKYASIFGIKIYVYYFRRAS